MIIVVIFHFYLTDNGNLTPSRLAKATSKTPGNDLETQVSAKMNTYQRPIFSSLTTVVLQKHSEHRASKKIYELWLLGYSTW